MRGGGHCVSNKLSVELVQSSVQSSQGTCVFIADTVRALKPEMTNKSATFEQLIVHGRYEPSVLTALVQGSGWCGLWNHSHLCTQSSMKCYFEHLKVPGLCQSKIRQTHLCFHGAYSLKGTQQTKQSVGRKRRASEQIKNQNNNLQKDLFQPYASNVSILGDV